MAKKLTKKEQEAFQRQRRRRRKMLAGAGILVLAAALILGIYESLFVSESEAQQITDSDAPLASFYNPRVLSWRSRILKWAKEYDVNPNVIAIVMQIESCGDPVAISGAGALGLMQVMPFHFPNGENMIDPDTNVRRGMGVFYECLTQFADWDLGLALACYNGGPSVTMMDPSQWAAETRAYYRWATGMWEDVVNHNETSQTLSDWLEAGGSNLCTDPSATTSAQPAE